MEQLTCPKCHNEMDFMGFLKSPSPWHLKCSYCKTKLKLQRYELHSFFIAIFAGILALTGLAYYNASSLMYAIVLTATVAGFEYLMFMLISKLGVGLEER